MAYQCGLFGRKEIGALLRIPRNPWLNYKLYARRLYLIGLGVRASRIVPLSWSLFLLLVLHFKFFLVVGCCLFFYCFSLCSPSWTPCIYFLLFFSLFNNTLITIKKKIRLLPFCSLFWQLTRFYYFFFCNLLGLATTSISQHQQNWLGRIISFILGRWVIPILVIYNVFVCVYVLHYIHKYLF